MKLLWTITSIIMCCVVGNYSDSTSDSPDQLPNLNLLPTQCGVVAAQNRIVGGSNAALGEFPWLARIGYRKPDGVTIVYRCIGSLINDKYVLTAAHCLTRLPENLTLATVRLGEYDLSTDPDCVGEVCADPIQEFTPEEAIPHESYFTPKRHNDIGIIRLDRPATISSYVSPICLPLGPKKNYTGQNGIVAGWNQLSYVPGSRNESRILEKITLTVVSHSQCVNSYSLLTSIYNITIAETTQICAGGEEAKDACPGDSGGPLMLPGQNGADGVPRYEAIGVVNWGGGRDCGTKDRPGVYANVHAFLNWILGPVNYYGYLGQTIDMKGSICLSVING